MIVPIGGGGLCAGVASAVKLASPRTLVFGVEPEGADSMHRSFAAGSPQAIDAVRTIADSLGAPHAAPYSFGLCRRYVDDLVRVSDDELRRAMYLLFASAKLAVEPAGAAATAALCGPLLERLRGKRVGVVVCGANIDHATFAAQVAAGAAEPSGPSPSRPLALPTLLREPAAPVAPGGRPRRACPRTRQTVVCPGGRSPTRERPCSRCVARAG